MLTVFHRHIIGAAYQNSRWSATVSNPISTPLYLHNRPLQTVPLTETPQPTTSKLTKINRTSPLQPSLFQQNLTTATPKMKLQATAITITLLGLALDAVAVPIADQSLNILPLDAAFEMDCRVNRGHESFARLRVSTNCLQVLAGKTPTATRPDARA
jgi:hypothetical protein